MYDTINFRREVAGDQLPAILNHLEGVTEHTTEDRVTFTGHIGNYKANVSELGLWLTGSLAKHHLGDNIHTLTRSDTARAIEQLSDEIGVPLDIAQVTRVDLAANLITSQRPTDYYPFLIESKRYERHPDRNSLYFRKENRVKIFYDKIHEAQSKGVTIPEAVTGCNLLRFELRLLNRVNRQLNDEVTGKRLSEEKFYMNLLNLWYAEYQNITKQRTIMLNTERIQSPKDFWKQGNQQWLHLIGLDAALQMVDQLKALQTFDKPEYYSRLKKEIRVLYKDTTGTQDNPLMRELDEKIKRTRMHYR